MMITFFSRIKDILRAYSVKTEEDKQTYESVMRTVPSDILNIPPVD